VTFGLEASEAVNDNLLSFGSVAPAFDVDELLGLEVLVASKEVLDLFAGLLGNIRDVLNVSPTRVFVRNHDDLGIGAGFITHVENADGANLDAYTGKYGVFEQDERVNGVTVEAQGVLEIAVIGGVRERREQHAIQVNATGQVVNFVLVAASLGDFNNNVICGHGITPSNFFGGGNWNNVTG
jgi:hypothetical protein